MDFTSPCLTQQKILPWLLNSLTTFIITVAGDIFGLKSIAAYRSGLEINTNVSERDAEEGLIETLQGEYSTWIRLWLSH